VNNRPILIIQTHSKHMYVILQVSGRDIDSNTEKQRKGEVQLTQVQTTNDNDTLVESSREYVRERSIRRGYGLLTDKHATYKAGY
jgi:hypothetical protein